MTKKLDMMIESYIAVKRDALENIPESEREEYLEPLREKIKKDVVEEVKQEYKAQVMADAENDIQQRISDNKISQLKNLMWNGFLIAFLVGLAVNQITDLIGYWKGSVSLSSLMPTLIITVVLVAICMGLYFYNMVKDTVDMYKKIKK